MPSETASAAAGLKTKGDIFSAELQGYTETMTADGTVMASGTVQYKAQNGTVLWIQALTAPLVKKDVLEYVIFYSKFASSTASTVSERRGTHVSLSCTHTDRNTLREKERESERERERERVEREMCFHTYSDIRSGHGVAFVWNMSGVMYE
jgi:hypothetical protein